MKTTTCPICSLQNTTSDLLCSTCGWEFRYFPIPPEGHLLLLEENRKQSALKIWSSLSDAQKQFANKLENIEKNKTIVEENFTRLEADYIKLKQDLENQKSISTNLEEELQKVSKQPALPQKLFCLLFSTKQILHLLEGSSLFGRIATKSEGYDYSHLVGIVDNEVSDTHFAIRIHYPKSSNEELLCQIKNLSPSGTYVNSDKLGDEWTAIEARDIIKIGGNTEMTLLLSKSK